MCVQAACTSCDLDMCQQHDKQCCVLLSTHSPPISPAHTHLLTSTVLPFAAVNTSPGRRPLPATMFSHEAMMKWTWGGVSFVFLGGGSRGGRQIGQPCMLI